MPRVTHHLWVCHLGHTNPASNLRCQICGVLHFQPNAQVPESSRAVVWSNPSTGERRTPPRNDIPLPAVYAKQGFERQEIMSMSAFQKQTGLIHEQTDLLPGNEDIPMREPERPKLKPEVVRDLAEDLRAAFASGEWTDNTGVLK